MLLSGNLFVCGEKKLMCWPLDKPSLPLKAGELHGSFLKQPAEYKTLSILCLKVIRLSSLREQYNQGQIDRQINKLLLRLEYF